MNFTKLNTEIAIPDEEVMQETRLRWDSIAKPLGSLGKLEDAIVRIAGLTGSAGITLNKRAVLVMCADNGVVCEGVAQTIPEVTAIMADHISRGQSSVCKMGEAANVDIIPVDIGMLTRVKNVADYHISNGTRNIAVEPAMTCTQAEQAIQTGIDLVKKCKDEGYKILATGEMGIGNTTTSSAVASVLLGISVEQVTGRGAGLSDEKLKNKIEVIKRAISVNKPDPEDAFDILSKLGGYDIAAMTGIFLGGAIYRIPIIIDGLISSVAALIAARLCPNAKCAMIASHCSQEPAAVMVLKALGLDAVLHAGMRLGEGTGAVCMVPILDMALAVYNGMTTYQDAGIEAYTPQEGIEV